MNFDIYLDFFIILPGQLVVRSACPFRGIYLTHWYIEKTALWSEIDKGPLTLNGVTSQYKSEEHMTLSQHSFHYVLYSLIQQVIHFPPFDHSVYFKYIFCKSQGCFSLHHLLFCHNFSLEWRHNEHDCISNHQPHNCLLNPLFRRRSKET